MQADLAIRLSKIITEARYVNRDHHVSNLFRSPVLLLTSPRPQRRACPPPDRHAPAQHARLEIFICVRAADLPSFHPPSTNFINIFRTRSPGVAFSFFRCALLTLRREWFGIDRLRMDKFLMFVRKLLHESFRFLGRQNWSLDAIQRFSTLIQVSRGRFVVGALCARDGARRVTRARARSRARARVQFSCRTS